MKTLETLKEFTIIIFFMILVGIMSIIKIFYFIFVKNFWKAFATIVFLTLVFQYMSFIEKKTENEMKYWDEQIEICHQAGWYSRTGKSDDCEPVEYIQKMMEQENYE